jgi:transitional endoplasmic reticulum ATPase
MAKKQWSNLMIGKKSSYHDIVCLWALRIAIYLGGVSAISLDGFGSKGPVGRLLKLNELKKKGIDDAGLANHLKERLEFYETLNPAIQGTLRRNLQFFKKQIGLTPTDVKLLGFAAIMGNHKGLYYAADLLDEHSRSEAIEYLGVILEVSTNKIEKALSSQGALVRSGILWLDNDWESLGRRMNTIPGLLDQLLVPHKHPEDMLRRFYSTCNSATLSTRDFKYLEQDYQLLRDYLAQARQQNKPGVNVLIYGPPGSGKTEFTRTLTADLGSSLYEVALEESPGEPITGSRRFTAYQLSQRLLRNNKKSLILFDEIEDVFDNSEFKLGSDRRKAWINRLLETNPVPAFWITNEITQINPAFVRRFDYILKMEAPPEQARVEIYSRQLAPLLVNAQCVERIADNEVLTPAVVSRAAEVVMTAGSATEQTPGRLFRLLNNALVAMGQPGLPENTTAQKLGYRLEALNPDQDLAPLVKGLQHQANARICLYGPPGTGKTQFGHYLCKTLNKRLLVRRASDLLNAYVGTTEKNIANMFQQARREGQAILIDEADSLLRDRLSARNQWEVTQVNELLTQMEDFNDLFICSTNLMDNLDSASLRRFDYKIHLRYLTPEQSWGLFQSIMQDANRSTTRLNEYRGRLTRLTNLTPGDFSTILRQAAITGQELTPERLLAGLAAESEMKSRDSGRGMGFTAHVD